MPPDILTLSERCSALERENARLRALLDDIHRRRVELPPHPAGYDAAIVEIVRLSKEHEKC